MTTIDKRNLQLYKDLLNEFRKNFRVSIYQSLTEKRYATLVVFDARLVMLINGLCSTWYEEISDIESFRFSCAACKYDQYSLNDWLSRLRSK